MAMSTASQGIWHQELIDGKQVWHFYPSHAMTLRPAAAAVTTTIEAPPPVTSADKIIVHPPGQFPTVAGAGASAAGGGPQLTYNVYNTYNYPTPAAVAAAAAAAAEAKKEEEEAAAKAVEAAKKEKKQEGIMITEEEVRMDALLHEHAEALRMRRHLQTVDYGFGDVCGRRWVCR